MLILVGAVMLTTIQRRRIGRRIVVGDLIRIDARDRLLNVILIIGVHTVQDGTMGSITVEKGRG